MRWDAGRDRSQIAAQARLGPPAPPVGGAPSAPMVRGFSGSSCSSPAATTACVPTVAADTARSRSVARAASTSFFDASSSPSTAAPTTSTRSLISCACPRCRPPQLRPRAPSARAAARPERRREKAREKTAAPGAPCPAAAARLLHQLQHRAQQPAVEGHLLRALQSGLQAGAQLPPPPAASVRPRSPPSPWLRPVSPRPGLPACEPRPEAGAGSQGRERGVRALSVMSPAEPAHTMWSNAKKAAMDSALAWADGQRVSLGESGNPTRGRRGAEQGTGGRRRAGFGPEQQRGAPVRSWRAASSSPAA